MNKKLVIVGAGGFGREVLWQIQQNPKEAEKYEILGFVDDNPEIAGKEINSFFVLGNLEWLYQQTEYLSIVIAIGNSTVRKRISERLAENKHFDFPTIAASGVFISETVKYGKGCFFCFNTIATVNIEIGDFFVSNWNCTIGHDCRIEDYVTLYPNVNVSGGVCIGENTEVGTGTQIIQGITLGSNCMIAAGAVVVENIPDNHLAAGVPAKIKKELKN